MTAAVAAMWGSSFLWIAIAIDHVETGVVPLGRCLFGALVLAMFPAVLLSRAGTVRGMIGIFFTPIVGTILGVAVRGDSLHAWAILGMSIVIVGAVMVSRPEPQRAVLPERLPEIGDEVGGALDPH